MNAGTDITRVTGSADRARTLFRRVYGTEPVTLASAPGRVNLIGDHIDYCGGLVVPRVLAHLTAVAIGPRASDEILGVSEAFASESDGVQQIGWKQLAPGNVAGWFAYVAGTLACLAQDGTLPELAGRGLRLAIASDVPVGAGLSSSAALEVATARAAIALLQDEGGKHNIAATRVSEHNISNAARRAEHLYAGVPCGIMDQVVCASGRADYCTAIDCQTGNITHVPWPQDISIVVLDSGIKHNLAAGEYALRRHACERAFTKLRSVCPTILNLCSATPSALSELAREADTKGYEEWAPVVNLTPEEVAAWQHVTTEHALAVDFCRAIEQGNSGALGRIYAASHHSLSRVYNVSCSEVDTLVERVIKVPGVIGARMTGGGFGGCVVVLCHTTHAPAALKEMLTFDVPRGFCLM